MRVRVLRRAAVALVVAVFLGMLNQAASLTIKYCSSINTASTAGSKPPRFLHPVRC